VEGRMIGSWSDREPEAPLLSVSDWRGGFELFLDECREKWGGKLGVVLRAHQSRPCRD
jgi:hypothetical protein